MSAVGSDTRSTRPELSDSSAPPAKERQQVLEAMEDLLTTLTEAIPASPVSAKSKREDGGLERDLSGYFAKVFRALPKDAIARLYNSQVKE